MDASSRKAGRGAASLLIAGSQDTFNLATCDVDCTWTSPAQAAEAMSIAQAGEMARRRSPG
jgi:hypothetical protein